jgi:hypothetical protein
MIPPRSGITGTLKDAPSFEDQKLTRRRFRSEKHKAPPESSKTVPSRIPPNPDPNAGLSYSTGPNSQTIPSFVLTRYASCYIYEIPLW